MRIIFMGPSGGGKSTLLHALSESGEKVTKTQAMEFKGTFIDTPGEYMQLPRFYHILIDSANRSEVIILVQDSTAQQVGMPPGFGRLFRRPVLGVISKLDPELANPQRARRWLEQAGIAAEHIYPVSVFSGEGMADLRRALREVGKKNNIEP